MATYCHGTEDCTVCSTNSESTYTVNTTYLVSLCHCSENAEFILCLFIWCWWKSGSNPIASIASKPYCVTWGMARTVHARAHKSRLARNLANLYVWSASWSWENLSSPLQRNSKYLMGTACLSAARLGSASALCDCTKCALSEKTGGKITLTPNVSHCLTTHLLCLHYLGVFHLTSLCSS